MKKQLLAGMILGVSVMASAHTALFEKTFAGGFRDAAVDTKGNLFVITGDGAEIQKIDHNGNVVWSYNPGTQFHHIAVDSAGRVGAAYTTGPWLGVVKISGFSGHFISSDYDTVGLVDEIYDLAGSDEFYMAYRQGTFSVLSNGSVGTTVSSNGSALVLSGNPQGGVAVGIRDTLATVRQYDWDMVMGHLDQAWEWQYTSNPFTAQKRLVLSHKADGTLLMSAGLDLALPWTISYGFRLSPAGALEAQGALNGDDTSQADAIRPTTINGVDVFFNQISGLTETVDFFSNYKTFNTTYNRVLPSGTGMIGFGASLHTYNAAEELFRDGTWTKPTGHFEVYPRPDGSYWVVETAATNAKLIRVTPGSKAVKDLFVMNEDGNATAFNVAANDVLDFVGGITTIEWQNLPSSGLGAVTGESDNGSFTFTPNADQSGAVDFAYRHVNTIGGSTPWQNVRVVVKPVNDRPVGNADSYTIGRGQLLTVAVAEGVLDNDTDADSHALTVVLHRIPQRGALNLASDGSFTYQAPMQAGTYTFLYRAKDVSMHCAPVTVTITVN